MNTFTDTEGRVWTLKVTYATLVRVQEATGVDLTKILDPGEPATDDAMTSPLTMMRVLCAVLRPQLDERRISDAAFAESLLEEQAEAAGISLYQAVIDFFRGPKRETLASAFRTMIDAARRRQEAATKAFAATWSKDRIETEAAKVWGGGKSAADTPASSESTPDH